jgi:heme oxygenase
VDSGVPQYSVLGPGLFLYYINDLQSRLTSTVRLFADDTIAHLTISNDNDAETLQKDLDMLRQWENEWCMKFHPDKCTSNLQKENN